MRLSWLCASFSLAFVAKLYSSKGYIEDMGSVMVRFKLQAIFLLSFLLYGYALFPGRIYGDSVTLIELMSLNQSVDTWGASYFRLLQLITINGQYVFLMSLLIGAIFYITLFNFIKCLSFDSNVKFIGASIFVFTPFVGVFAFTIGHDGLIASSFFIYLSFLLKNSKKLCRKDIGQVIFAALLASTSGLGVILTIGFCVALVVRKLTVLSLISIVISTTFFFAGTSILGVEKSKYDMSIMSFLGEVKCIAQHQDAVISDPQWASLISLGSKEDWVKQDSCSAADYSFFAFENASKDKIKIIKLWSELSRQNPQIALQARIQRTSVALPPIFFRNPPNMFDTSYFNPVGMNAMNDLQISADMFKTSVDLPPRLKSSLPGQSFFEYLVLFPTFLLNQRSDLWGWGGLWLCIAVILLYRQMPKKKLDLAVVFLPSLALHAGVVLFAPQPSPRYVFTSVLLGVFLTILQIVQFSSKRALRK
jgi:hypothetical protein